MTSDRDPRPVGNPPTGFPRGKRWGRPTESSGGALCPGADPGELADDDLAVFLEMSNEIFGVFDLTQGLVWSNGAAAALLGYSEEELVSMSLVDLIHPDDLGEALALFDQPSP